ncbi:MAG: PD40 domain-containing protein [Chloroflexi bacterium]|nr:PD40 domain-containing protein [Chloroflexota bacterium]
MKLEQRKTARAGAAIASTVMAGAVLLNAIPAAAVEFAHPAFKNLWDRTDSLVASGQVSRTFFWGPEPRAAAQEQYVDAPNGTGTRLVQYFDKSRMEINDPGANASSPFFVTNGLLTIELISGQMQIGNNAFVNRYPAVIPISGDVDDTQAPTYASFISVSNTRRGDHPQPDRTGQFATSTINQAGQVGNDPAKASVPGTKIVYFEPSTKHNIPERFWQFLNATGPISQTGQIINQRLIDPWFYASGLPISDAYWSRVKIKGVMQDVMIQAFERRVLTYVPTNEPGFQVEMGNIGLHYYDWRYKDAGKPTGTVIPATGTPGTAVPTVTGTVSTATATGTPGSPTPTVTGTPPTSTPTVTPTPNVITQGLIAFSSNRSGNFDIYTIKGDGTGAKDLTSNSPRDDTNPAFSPDYTKIAFTSSRDGNQDIYVMNADGSSPTRLTNDPADDYQPTWSPDGTKIAFVSKRSGGQADVYMMNSNGTNQTNLTFLAGDDDNPSWGVNNLIAFTSKRSGAAQIYTLNPDAPAAVTQITNTGENFLPKWNTVAKRIVFISTRDGTGEVYTMRPGGEEQTRLTLNSYNDWDPAYSPDNSKIVYAEEFGGDSTNLELYDMNIDGTNQQRLTIEPGKDQQPSWGLTTTK